MGNFGRGKAGVLALLVVGILLLTSLGVPRASGAPGPAAPSTAAPADLPSIFAAPLVAVPDHEPGVGLTGAIAAGPATAPSVTVLVSFGFANRSQLATLLGSIYDAKSPLYHHYLTAAQFDREFGIPSSEYATALRYFGSFGVTNLTSFADRSELSFSAPPAVIDRVFHTTLGAYRSDGHSYYAPVTAPELPSSLAGWVGSVEGLSSYSTFLNHVLLAPQVLQHAAPPALAPSSPSARPGYLTPPTVGGNQYEFAPDFQVAYDQLSLFAQEGYPTNEVIATILWSGYYLGTGPITTPNGTLTSGQNVGPFVPGDVSAFFNQTLPAGEPHPQVQGVPVDGAPSPGWSASYDVSEANVENTLDLEMAGSTAPGAQIYNVYGPTAQNVDLDLAFSTILNPNSTEPAALQNVSVITNSWGGTDANDTNWYNETEEAAARGISVLVASGDSGSDPSSAWGAGVFFPATMAYNDFGDIAVGGTTVTLNPSTLTITGDSVWWESATDTQLNGPAGSTGGISTVFAEPSWQLDTSANQVIKGAGRGVPDIAALANNTIMSITINGAYYSAINATRTGGVFLPVGGTSVASPLTAGLLADVDHVLNAKSNAPLGFADPAIYALADRNGTAYSTTATTGFYPTGSYYGQFPTLPYFDIVTGANYLYSARAGYDLATGWGTIDAYNFTMYVVTYQPIDIAGQLSAVSANFNLTGLAVTSTYPAYFGGGVNTFYNASIQQNFFLANSLGAPVYWVQNVIYINRTVGGWAMNFSGWVVFPFYGQYPSLAVYEYNFPLVGKILKPTIDFDITTTLVVGSGLDNQSVDFSFGVPGTSTLSLPVPGGSYIIGNLSYNYSWWGTNFSNGPYPAPYGGPGGLDPQFGLVGGPSGGTGNFGSATQGNLSLYLERMGTNQFLPGVTGAYGESITQTGETAGNLTWTLLAPGNRGKGTPTQWGLSYQSGGTVQGVYEYDSYLQLATYAANFSTTGLNASDIANGYYIAIVEEGGGFIAGYCFSSPCIVYLTNGSYTWYLGNVPGEYPRPSNGTFVIDGSGVVIRVAYLPYTYVVTFDEIGLPTGQTWWINVTAGGSYSSDNGTIAISFRNGSFAVAISSGLWSPHPPHTAVNVRGIPYVFDVSFTPPERFPMTFRETGLPANSSWSIELAGGFGGASTTNSSLGFDLLNGTYNFTAGTSLLGWSAVPPTGNVTINDSATSYTVQFAQPTYAVTFLESGLPAGTMWAVSIVNGPTLDSSGPNVTWNAINGMYAYNLSVDLAGYSAQPGNGTFTVSGLPRTLPATFVQVTYSVSFEELGLPNGTSWSVSITGAAPLVGSGSVLATSLPNGSYPFTVTVPSGYAASPPSGLVTVQGLGQVVTVHVHSSSSGTGAGLPLGLSSQAWILVAVVAAVVVVLAAALILRRRPPANPTASVESGGPPE